MFFNRNYSTKGLSNYWLNPKKDEKYWLEYLETWNHPHRYVLSNILGQLPWLSLIEIGCGSGPNLSNIIRSLPGKQVGGADINPIAIEVANKAFQKGHFRVGSGDDIMLSDKATDVILTDMMLIYVGPRQINKYLEEFKRVGRKYLVLYEYDEKSWWQRQKLRIFSGRHAYNYQHRLEKIGYNDIMKIPMPKFEEDGDQRFRQVIIARIPK